MHVRLITQFITAVSYLTIVDLTRVPFCLSNLKHYFTPFLVGAVLFANETLERLMRGGTDTNVTLTEIEAILQELRNRNFSKILMESGVEKERAEKAAKLAEDLHNKTIALASLVNFKNGSSADLIKTFLQITDGGKKAMFAANNGAALVKIAKMIDFQVSSRSIGSDFKVMKNFLTHTFT